MEAREQIEGRNRVQEAIAFYESAGKEATLRGIDKPDGQFVRNERHLFAVDLEGNMLAHPIKKDLTRRSGEEPSYESIFDRLFGPLE
ncbi:MAG TPA: hypothetical protein HPP81_09735 [Deltaproteobacteria bacterium]|jgi:hypothetical protein|nr:hypothetical protein [Deltaproteobacteria bacterium]HIJ76978.1 hypothetical protein [Deltaproteobacteria bacterium]